MDPDFDRQVADIVSGKSIGRLLGKVKIDGKEYERRSNVEYFELPPAEDGQQTK